MSSKFRRSFFFDLRCNQRHANEVSDKQRCEDGEEVRKYVSVCVRESERARERERVETDSASITTKRLKKYNAFGLLLDQRLLKAFSLFSFSLFFSSLFPNNHQTNNDSPTHTTAPAYLPHTTNNMVAIPKTEYKDIKDISLTDFLDVETEQTVVAHDIWQDKATVVIGRRHRDTCFQRQHNRSRLVFQTDLSHSA